MVLFAFVASAVESAEFDWSTEPFEPGLSTRTGRFAFFAPIWTASEAAPANCRLPASCFATWMSVGLLQPQEPLPAPCFWSDHCLVVSVFDAVAVDESEFDWLTEPSLPPLSTRTELSTFSGSICLAEDAAPASWAFSADWSLL